ncbi:hypothetical protein [Lacticigenium naphthae]|uniref:hypothetical protein n=1 Tax=Lacticigenium naphthae TaxID=515351 RepID=UPI0004274F1F|nr:hypothetical protein [Lacticigenium naphthae]
MKIIAKWISLSATSVFLLTGCATEDAPQEDTSAVSENSVTSGEDVYTNMIDTAKEQYEANKYDAAAGTLSVLLQNDLSDFEAIQVEAQGLLSEINQIQADEVKKELEQTETNYQTERSSEIANQEFEKDTEQPIKEATDEEIEAWLAKNESAKSVKAEEIDQEAKDTSESTSENMSEELNQEVMATEKETEVLNKVMEKLEIDPRGYEFFLVEAEGIYQVEVREPLEIDEVEISHLIAIVEYNTEEDTYKKLDPVTGEYGPF